MTTPTQPLVEALARIALLAANTVTADTRRVDWTMGQIREVADAALAAAPAPQAEPRCKLAAFADLPCVVEHCTGSCFREQNDTRAAPSLTVGDELTDDQCIELAAALEMHRALHIVAEVAALPMGGKDANAPTPFQAGYRLACEEITERIRTQEIVIPGSTVLPQCGTLPSIAQPAATVGPDAHCMCHACKGGTTHASDCAVHNGPAEPAGPCDCYQAVTTSQPAAQGLGEYPKRVIFDAIRGAYDLGYNDARNARTVPGDSAPGYTGRQVEVDHGGALIATLDRLAAQAPAAEPLTDEQCDQAAAQAMDRVAKARDMHALDLNPDITAHHTLRRELIRAGAALAVKP